MLKTKGENNNHHNHSCDIAVVKYYTTQWSFEEKVVKTLPEILDMKRYVEDTMYRPRNVSQTSKRYQNSNKWKVSLNSGLCVFKIHLFVLSSITVAQKEIIKLNLSSVFQEQQDLEKKQLLWNLEENFKTCHFWWEGIAAFVLWRFKWGRDLCLPAHPLFWQCPSRGAHSRRNEYALSHLLVWKAHDAPGSSSTTWCAKARQSPASHQNQHCKSIFFLLSYLCFIVLLICLQESTDTRQKMVVLARVKHDSKRHSLTFPQSSANIQY